MVILVFGVGNFFGLVLGGSGGTYLYRRDKRYPALLAGCMAITGCIPFWILLNAVKDGTDPLFVIGFNDPIKPVVLGELKIPGYSTYLHPIGDGLLLAVGEETDEFSQMSFGNKISVYDVSNPALPTEKFKKVLSPEFYTESIYNHKSFKFHPASGVLALPSYGSGGYSDQYVSENAYGISLFKIDRELGILDNGFLNLASRGNADLSTGYSGPVHAVVSDGVVYGVDGLGIKAANVSAPSGQSWELPYQ